MFNDHGMLFLETYMDLEARGLVELETKSIKKNIQVRRNEREDDLSPPWEVQGKFMELMKNNLIILTGRDWIVSYRVCFQGGININRSIDQLIIWL